jgi:N-acetylglucosaminyldiphosphoundecaprenol N-acetyl-beta-D-mannosaminyltransferase
LDTPLPAFIPGIDLMTEMCRLACDEERSIYLLGAQPGVAEKAAANLQAIFPGLKVAGTHDGYFSREHEEQNVIAEIRDRAPSFLFVGMNVPWQEKWISRHLRALDVPIVMGVGGSFDVLSGQLRRAPLWMRRFGVEWVFRTLQQPWRLQRIKDLPVFMWRVLKQPH